MSRDISPKHYRKTENSAAEQSGSSRDADFEGSAELKALIDELDRPIENVSWSNLSTSGDGSEKSSGFLNRLRRESEHRRELRRARQAASRAFRVKPRLSARKQATLMLGAGAMGVSAFTAPQMLGDGFSSVIEGGSEYDDGRKSAELLSASEVFKRALAEEEGVRYTVYLDAVGHPTVGVGHLIRPEDELRVGDKVSKARVMAFLQADLAEAEKGVHLLVGGLPLHQHEFDALLDLVYNVGLGNVSPQESPRLNAAIDAGDYQAIAAELDYAYAGGKMARGLEFRSKRRTSMFLDASYDNPRKGVVSTSA